MSKYILINNTEDGDHYITFFDNENQVNKLLKEMLEENLEENDFIYEAACESNLNYSQGYMLIKGEIVVPKFHKEIIKEVSI